MFAMGRFILLYGGVEDPSVKEQKRLLSALKNAVVLDSMPGSILVEGMEGELALAMAHEKDWSFSPERSIGI
jgi:hypothetical protein